MKNQIAEQYIKSGKQLIILNDKIAHYDWKNIKKTPEQIRAHKGSLGWELEETDLVIDVDPRNNGDVSFNKLCKLLNIKLIPTVLTASGGFHYYFKIPAGYKIRKTLREYPGVDFLSAGAYCVIPGSICKKKYPKDVEEPIEPEMVLYEWYDKELGCFEQLECPKDILSVCANNIQLQEKDFGISSNSNWTEEKIKELLEKIDPSMPNDEWVKVGMALHDWDPIMGLDLWEEWSKDGENYDEGETEKRWRSFDIGGGVTLGTILYMAKEADLDGMLHLVNKYIEKIKNASELDLRLNIFPELKKQNFDKIDSSRLVKAIKDRYKVLYGSNVPVGEIREAIGNKVSRGNWVPDGQKPEWCNDWIYVDSHCGFMNIHTLKISKTESFNLQNGIYVPLSEGGGKCSALKYVADNKYIEHVGSTAYLPQTNDLICEINGSKVLNIFNPNTTPLAAEEYTHDGLGYIERVKNHIEFIFGNQSEIFIEYMAHLVQFPGKQILWAPVVHSIQGVGKSFFGELLRAVLGNVNVGVVSSNEVVSNFNGWATGVQVNILEEIRIKGHNRHDAVNALKPLISDRYIQINEKGVKPFMTFNTVNYICFTNYKDAIPMDDDDRRWWVNGVKIQHMKDLYDYVGEHKETYFPKLFDNLDKYSGELRKWLLEYEISEKFLNTKQAPMTTYKEAMIAAEEMGYEGLVELKELIQKGSTYYNEICISSSELFNDFSFEYPEININNARKNQLLKRLGYMPTSAPIKIDGKTRRIWTKNPMTNDKIRKNLENL